MKDGIQAWYDTMTRDWNARADYLAGPPAWATISGIRSLRVAKRVKEGQREQIREIAIVPIGKDFCGFSLQPGEVQVLDPADVADFNTMLNGVRITDPAGRPVSRADSRPVRSSRDESIHANAAPIDGN